MHNHMNGLKTALLFSAIFALLLAIGGLIAGSTGNMAFLWIFALFLICGLASSYSLSQEL